VKPACPPSPLENPKLRAGISERAVMSALSKRRQVAAVVAALCQRRSWRMATNVGHRPTPQDVPPSAFASATARQDGAMEFFAVRCHKAASPTGFEKPSMRSW